jgi:hypothetical protein
MKWTMMALAVIVGVNFGLLLWNQAPLISSGQTTDQWSRSCKYYFPFRIIERTLPLSQSCPSWAEPD